MMNSRGRESDDDLAEIVDNEVIENPVQEIDIPPGVIFNYEPKKQLIEPAALLLFAGYTLFEAVLSNTIELQYCRTVFNLTEQQCFSNQVDHRLKEEYEKFASSFQLYKSLIEVTIPTFISFFIGPWSDIYGRKPLILSSLIGFSATYGLWTFASSIPSLPPLYFLLFSFPLAFSGGITIFILGVFCYVCDVTTLENRGARLGRLKMTLYVGDLVGTQLGPKLLPFGRTAVYGVPSTFICISLIYIYLFLDESIIPSQVELNSPKRNPFHLNHVKELYHCCYTNQTPKVRFTIFLLTMILSLSSIHVFGENGIMYLFLQRVLNWDLATYATLASFVVIVNAIGAYGGTWFLCNFLRLNDLLVLSIATFSLFLSALVMIFGYRVWHIYFAKLLSCSLGIIGSIIRLFLSRILAKDELGKVFSLLSLTESSTPLFASLLYSSLFNITVSTIPGSIFYLSAVLILFMLLCLAILVKMYVPEPSSTYSRSSQVVTQITSNNNGND